MILIKHKDYLLLADDAADRKVNDYYLGEGFAGVGLFQWHSSQEDSYPNQKQKIVAYYPLYKDTIKLNIPRLPYPFIKDEVDVANLALKYFEEEHNSRDHPDIGWNKMPSLRESYIRNFTPIFEAGFNAAKSVNKFSLEDLEAAFKAGSNKGAHHMRKQMNTGDLTFPSFDKYIESLLIKKLPKHFTPLYQEFVFDVDGYSGDAVPVSIPKKLMVIINSDGNEELVGKYDS